MTCSHPSTLQLGQLKKPQHKLYILMDSFKEYFSYIVYTECGIPKITLEGTVDDWKKLRDRALGLAQYDLVWWVEALEPVLDQFVACCCLR